MRLGLSSIPTPGDLATEQEQVSRRNGQEQGDQGAGGIGQLSPTIGTLSRAREENESQEDRWFRLHGDGWKLKFLQALKAHGVMTVACGLAKVSRETVYKYYAIDEVFSASAKDALEASVDAVELALRLNATEGQSRPVASNGKIIAWYRDRSDKAADILLRAHRPGRFRGEGAVTEVSIKLGTEAEVSSATKLALAALHARSQSAIETGAIEDELDE